MKLHKKLLQLCHSALLPLCLTGCMGVYEGGFECPPGEGVKCKSISDVNQMVNQGLGTKSQESGSNLSEESKANVCEHPGSCPLTSDVPEIWYSPWALEEV
ncbi:MAG: hypothetical protein BGO67_03915 [Alphaproteobacteria bacterium 41-28]|nr:MAG: hypothetical protein BGO67_03915 [Alphaproteobacteria bacterium 41-28]